MSTQLAALTSKLATTLNIGTGEGLVDVLKATAFKTKEPVTDSQMMALLIVANQYGLNPWTKEVYAYPDKNNGIVPVVGVDGWTKIINSHDQYDGMTITFSEKMIKLSGMKFEAPEWCEVTIHRKDRNHNFPIRERLEEVYREAFKSKEGYVITGPWQTHTSRLLRHKGIIQAARATFGFGGIYDQDEAERIIENSGQAPKTVTATVVSSQPLPVGYDDEKEAQYLEILTAAANGGLDALKQARKQFPEEHMRHFWMLKGESLKKLAIEKTSGQAES
jgi:phage recombination protein Bet